MTVLSKKSRTNTRAMPSASPARSAIPARRTFCGRTGELGGTARSTTVTLLLRMEAAMSVSFSFWSRTS